ncbi:MAG TPA: type II secretion system protein [Methylophilaceae bacterium]|jgi:type II secretory pathway pseudopilin PulG
MQTAYLHLNRSPDLKRSLGFTYIGLMLIVAIAGIALSGVGIVWKTEMQRENEKELRFAGEQYVAAIASYYECKVCGPQQLPKNLKDLLKDSRAPSVVHHIRKLYRDPMTRSNDWGLIKNGDRITGVYSKSKLEPLAKPYDVDLLKKKKNITQPGNTTSVNQANANPTNFNQVNANQAGVNQTSGNNSSNSVVGNNVADLNKLDAGKTSQPIKPKKPSYQDWQFVYGGGNQAAPSTSIVTSNAKETTNSNNVGSVQVAPNISQQDADAESWSINEGVRRLQLCTEPYEAAQQVCNDLCGSGSATNSECRKCKMDADNEFKLCKGSVQ